MGAIFFFPPISLLFFNQNNRQHQSVQSGAGRNGGMPVRLNRILSWHCV